MTVSVASASAPMDARYMLFVASLFLVSSAATLGFIAQPVAAGPSDEDFKVLSEIYSSFMYGSANFPTHKNASSVCSWFFSEHTNASVCASNSSSFHVTEVQLSGRQLKGIVPWTAICKLQSLQRLDLSNNSLNGPLQLSECQGLVYLNLSCNSFQGDLSSLNSLGTLRHLDLARNKLNGSLGYLTYGLTNLISLNLSHNAFSTEIPTFRELNMLEEVSLSFNNFSGEIDPDIGSHKNLKVLDLSQNNLHGTIPDIFQNLTNLTYLILSANKLHGNLPPSIVNLTSLVYLSANSNNLNGTLPESLGALQNLSLLDLSYNQFEGAIPSKLFDSKKFQSIDLSSNKITGNIPDSLYACKDLRRIRLGWNMLNGSISNQVGALLKLQTFQANVNQLVGVIPNEFRKCVSLSFLDVSKNKIEGRIAPKIGDKFQLLNLSSNHLSGKIPENLVNDEMLTLDLSHNQLSGRIPEKIFQTNLLFLRLGNNNLTGPIPATVPDGNQLLELDLASNHLNGAIPIEIGKFHHLQVSLNLGHNNLEGNIPAELSSLVNLVFLDLSNNKLSGKISAALSSMGSLVEFDVSNNGLWGDLPAFNHLTSVNINGTYIVKKNPDDGKGAGGANGNSSGFATRLFIAVTLTGAGMGLIVLGISVVVCKYYVPKRVETVQVDPPTIQGYFLLPLSDSIQRESIDFESALKDTLNPQNLIFKQKLNDYYRVTMPSATVYTVKKLKWVDRVFKAGGLNVFQSSIQEIAKYQHPNIMKPLAYAIGVDSVLLIYQEQYKANIAEFVRGSLNAVDWISRYDIALRVARGLVYLHSCFPPLIHLDFSTKNIFLSSSGQPQIGDIELCQIGDNSEYNSLSATAGYIPPEYAYTMTVTKASNVYSFGVVLLELLTGQPPIVKGKDLATWVKEAPSRDEPWEQILDSRISTYSFEIRKEMMAVLKIALQCTKSAPQARPDMKSIVQMLQIVSL